MTITTTTANNKLNEVSMIILKLIKSQIQI